MQRRELMSGVGLGVFALLTGCSNPFKPSLADAERAMTRTPNVQSTYLSDGPGGGLAYRIRGKLWTTVDVDELLR